MALGVGNIRSLSTIDTYRRYTSLPIVPSSPATVAASGDEYPSSRVVRRSDFSLLSGQIYTWIAHLSNPATSSQIGNIVYKTVNAAGDPETQICDPAYVDWASVTRTGRRPNTVFGGRARYYYNIGPVSIDSGSGPVYFADGFETRQPIMDPATGTFVDARKLAPLFNESIYNVSGGSVAVGVGGNDLYDTAFLVANETQETKLLRRRLNGSADETALSRGGVLVRTSDTDPANIVDVYIANVDPGTLIADLTTATLAGTLTPGSTDSFYITDAIFASASIDRWNQYITFTDLSVGTGAISPGESVVADYYSPVDIPPPYDCPGVDGVIMGGYYA